MHISENKPMKVVILMIACWRKWGDWHQPDTTDLENEAKGFN